MSLCSDFTIIDPTHPILEPVLELLPLIDGFFFPFWDIYQLKLSLTTDTHDDNDILKRKKGLFVYQSIDMIYPQYPKKRR